MDCFLLDIVVSKLTRKIYTVGCLKRVFFLFLKDGPQTLNEEEVSATQTTAVIQGLKPGISYALAVVAENEIGHGEPSETIRFVTSEEGLKIFILL